MMKVCYLKKFRQASERLAKDSRWQHNAKNPPRKWNLFRPQIAPIHADFFICANL